MLGEVGRKGRDGQIIVFRLQSDESFLWKVASNRVPDEDELVGRLTNGNVTTWYKVEAIKNEIWYASGKVVDENGVPIEEWASEYGVLCPCVLVSEV